MHENHEISPETSHNWADVSRVLSDLNENGPSDDNRATLKALASYAGQSFCFAEAVHLWGAYLASFNEGPQHQDEEKAVVDQLSHIVQRRIDFYNTPAAIQVGPELVEHKPLCAALRHIRKTLTPNGRNQLAKSINDQAQRINTPEHPFRYTQKDFIYVAGKIYPSGSQQRKEMAQNLLVLGAQWLKGSSSPLMLIVDSVLKADSLLTGKDRLAGLDLLFQVADVYVSRGDLFPGLPLALDRAKRISHSLVKSSTEAGPAKVYKELSATFLTVLEAKDPDSLSLETSMLPLLKRQKLKFLWNKLSSTTCPYELQNTADFPLASMARQRVSQLSIGLAA